MGYDQLQSKEDVNFFGRGYKIILGLNVPILPEIPMLMKAEKSECDYT